MLYVWLSDLYHHRKKFLVQQAIYTHRKIIKAPLLHQSLGPCVFLSLTFTFLSLTGPPDSGPLKDPNRLQHNIFFSPTTIVNTALFVFNFLNLPHADILIKAEKDFEALKDTSFPLPICYQDGLTQQWESGKLILQGKGYACISPDGPNEISWLPLQKIRPREASGIQDREETAKSPGGGVSSRSHGNLKNFQQMLHSR